MGILTDTNLPQLFSFFYRITVSLIYGAIFNVDAKILTKVLARRLESALPLIISEDQTGFIKNRIPILIHVVYLTLYCPSDAIPECVLSLDTGKAFDHLEWLYLFTILENLNFGPNFI